MKRDLYAEVSTRIVAELEAGAAPWVKPWSATPGVGNVVLLWMAQAAGYRTPRFLTFKQAVELGGNVRKGEHGTKVYFVKQLQVRDQAADDSSSTRLIPMMREYTVFNVDQCENLPDSITAGKPLRVRNPDARDGLSDDFLRSLARIFAKATAKLSMSRAGIFAAWPLPNPRRGPRDGTARPHIQPQPTRTP